MTVNPATLGYPSGPIGTRHNNIEIMKDAVDLLLALTPDSPHATIHVEMREWIKLQRVLQHVPKLVREVEQNARLHAN